nr:hypothetical protein Iba_chr14aCG5150 [Ipomoea batatas]
MTINGSISGAARGTTRVRATVEASGDSLSVRYKRKVAVKFGDNVPVDDNKQSRAMAGFIPVLLPAVQGSGGWLDKAAVHEAEVEEVEAGAETPRDFGQGRRNEEWPPRRGWGEARRNWVEP